MSTPNFIGTRGKNVAILFVFCLSCTLLKSQPTYCSALSNGSGASYGGNITTLEIQDDTGLIFAYNGFTNNVSANLINSGSPFDIVGNEYLAFKLKGTSDSSNSKWWTKCGIWVDANNDGNFTADECAADPVSGPFKRLIKDTAVSALIHIPSISTTAKIRVRIRGCVNNGTMTAASGCANTNSYGNQYDFEVNGYFGVSGTLEYSIQRINIQPNPAGDKTIIQAANAIGLVQKIEVVNTQGQIVKSMLMPAMENNSCQLSTADLPMGTYIVKMLGTNGSAASQLVVTR